MKNKKVKLLVVSLLILTFAFTIGAKAVSNWKYCEVCPEKAYYKLVKIPHACGYCPRKTYYAYVCSFNHQTDPDYSTTQYHDHPFSHSVVQKCFICGERTKVIDYYKCGWSRVVYNNPCGCPLY